MPDDNNLPTTDPTRPVLTTEEVSTPSTSSGQANPPAQDQNQPTAPTSTPAPIPNDTPPPIPDTTDVPPPPPGTEPTDTVVPPTSNIQPPASSFDLSPIVGTPPKKKFGGKRVISTILGLLLLVAGVAAGVIGIGQQKFFGQQAAECEPRDQKQCVTTDKCDGIKTCNSKGKWGKCTKKPGGECDQKSGTGGGGGGGTSGAFCNLSTGKKCASGYKCVETPGAGGDGTCQSTQQSTQSNFEEICKSKGGKCVDSGLVASSAYKNCDKLGAQDCIGSDVCVKCAGTSGGGGGGGGGGSTIPKGNCSNSSAAQCQSTKKPGDVCHDKPGGSPVNGTCIDTGKTGPEAGGPPICRCKVPETGCKEACPGSDGILRNCTPPEPDGTPEESICSKTGRIESCGGKSYCCPAPGGKWTTDMAACQGSGTCLNVKAYKGDDTFTSLTTDDLKALKTGDKVRFAVAGSVSTGTSGTYDKAKFKINSTESGEVTQQKPGSNEFWYEYTIPDGITSFNIGAQIHHSVLGWSN